MLGTQEFDVLWLSMTVRRLFINNAVFDVENSQSVLRSRLYLIFIIVCNLFLLIIICTGLIAALTWHICALEALQSDYMTDVLCFLSLGVSR